MEVAYRESNGQLTILAGYVNDQRQIISYVPTMESLIDDHVMDIDDGNKPPGDE